MTNPTSSLTDEQVAAIRARLDARTPGQWLHRTVAPYGYVAKCGDSADASEYVTPRDLDWPANGAHHDAEFIAHAPEDIAALLTDRDRLARRVEEMEADKARLDWLESQTAFDGKWYYEEDGFNCPTMQFGVWPNSWEGLSLRAAIDTARNTPAPRPTAEETPSPSPAQETP